MKTVILTFAQSGWATAERLKVLTGGDIVDNAATALPRFFAEGRPIIGVCAAGILIRLLAPHLGDKHAEPPVIAVSQDGVHIVPLLGGHHGANRLARELATGLGGTAALTTASDSRFARALDDPPPGWVLANPGAAKSAMAALLAGASIRLTGDMPWLAEAGYPITDDGTIIVTATTAPTGQGLLYHPHTIVAGMGCERGTPADEIITLLTQTLAASGLSLHSLAAIGTIDLKADEVGLVAAAAHFNVPLRLFTKDELGAESAPNPSAIVEAEIGTPSVAEAAAQKAGTLLVPKQKSKRATCAIGIATTPLAPATYGRTPGALHIIGIGPGDAASRTASAVAALEASTDWVGYGLYLDLVADLRFGRAEHRFPLGDEEPRVRHALELAATGKTVALVCSGDGQIFAMAALVYELLEATGARALSPAARRVGVASHPGISALQAASAAAGALIGHDFCAISLSDLLTPRDKILQHLEAAATGDFVTALYNPRSQRRIDLLDTARDIFARHRPPETPVIVAKNLGRPEETVTVVPLSAFDPTTVDMLTIVLFGATASRAFTRGDGRTVAYTPRGYAKKAAASGSPA